MFRNLKPSDLPRIKLSQVLHVLVTKTAARGSKGHIPLIGSCCSIACRSMAVDSMAVTAPRKVLKTLSMTPIFLPSVVLFHVFDPHYLLHLVIKITPRQLTELLRGPLSPGEDFRFRLGVDLSPARGLLSHVIITRRLV